MTTTSPSPTTPPSRNRQAALARVLTWQEDSAPHPAMEELQRYVEAQLRGTSYETDYAVLAYHLDACVVCAEAYSHLYELILGEETESLALPERVPEADLTFLQPTAQTDLATQIRNAIEVVGQRLTFQLRSELLPGLQPTLAGATFRLSNDEERYHELILELNDEELPLTVAAYRDMRQPSHCLLEITIAPPDRSWPDLADIEVTVQLSGENYTAPTDAWGLAVFTGVPITELAEMRVEAAL